MGVWSPSFCLLNFTRQHCPSYRLQWWSCPGATQWGTPFSKEGLSERALAGGSRNPWVRRRTAVSIDTNNKLVSLHLCVCMCVCVCVCECGVAEGSFQTPEPKPADYLLVSAP